MENGYEIFIPIATECIKNLVQLNNWNRASSV